jgi:hypothetical protein
VTVQRRIGFWSSPSEPDWPDPQTFVDASWDPLERESVALYLKSGLPIVDWMGYSACRFCGMQNGASDLSDGTYYWPEGLAHYIESHGVRLPAEFVAHVASRTPRYQDTVMDDLWWLGQKT